MKTCPVGLNRRINTSPARKAYRCIVRLTRLLLEGDYWRILMDARILKEDDESGLPNKQADVTLLHGKPTQADAEAAGIAAVYRSVL